MVVSDKKLNIMNIFKILGLSLMVLLVCLFFMSKKENLDIDEIYTYGLANNSFQLDIKDNIEYSGKDLLLKYASVKEGDEFNIRNVFFNQEHDTHPPLYYILVNFICSLNAGKFSIWYGLIINIIFMIVIFWEINYLIKLITKSEAFSLIISFISLFFYGFINMYVFTRMYVMLSVISLAFIIHVVSYMFTDKSLVLNQTNKLIVKDKKVISIEEIKYLIVFYIICVLGILTQYHFMIIAGIYSLFFTIYLIKNKEYKFLVLVIVLGLLAIFTSYLIFPSMFNHLFGAASLHGLKSEGVYTLTEKFVEFYLTLVKSFSGNIILLSTILLLCILSLVLIKNRILLLIFISIVFYYIVISVSATFTFARYLYNIYPLIIIFIASTVYLLCRKYVKVNVNISRIVYSSISIAVMLILCILSMCKSYPFSLNIGDSKFHNYLYQNKDVKIILLYRTKDSYGNENTMSGTSKWKLPRPLYSLKDMSSLLFCDIDNMSNLYIDKYKNEKKVYVIIYTSENDEMLINQIINKLNQISYEKGFFTGKNKIYFNDYYHMYLLTKS